MYMNLNRIEFVTTYQCTGQCKHCSVDDPNNIKGHIEYEKMKGILQKLSKMFEINSVMCFGGEPLLFSDDVCKIISEAKESKIPSRQIITNGYFSKSNSKIYEIVHSLVMAGITEVMLSVDAFHQEQIPIEPVYEFAKAMKETGVKIKLHPAWVIDTSNDNEWNKRTKDIINIFSDLELPVSKGNNIFMSGNAIQYLSEFYPKQEVNLNYYCGQAPYTAPLDHISSISIMPNGDVNICCFVIGNVYREDIEEIIRRYNPQNDLIMKILLNEGVGGLVEYAGSQGISIIKEDYYTTCGVCRSLVRQLIN